jgi:hypothetical protein
MGLVKDLRAERPKTLGGEQAKARFFVQRGWRFHKRGGGWVAEKGGLKCGPRPCMRSLLNRVQVAEAMGK